MATIYELTGKYLELVDHEEDLDPTLFHDTLDSITGATEDKANGYAMVDLELSKDEEGLKDEAQRLLKRAKNINTNRKVLRQSLQEAMEAMGMDIIKTDNFTISIRKNPPSVNINDESKIPAYLTKVVYSVDKKEVGNRLKKGEDIPGAELLRKRSLRIK
ncbi:siphovirus Gp157 family protein [Companilactobacillus allii]|uniref:Siphovirus Gp157 family protein n=1 Tax=Companilactobacillus allii TaxID=1847728 RepID=A0A1P8Q5K7_9LACO|nr:siphovirus Gp157 family protein [Companilactobacillus allii]APX73136.1 hypothetical protein BTM29_11490 [Companilactobacillus allii]USQ67940.1 siphovirus Gp157 family protein [Companilactobacillus allii]